MVGIHISAGSRSSAVIGRSRGVRQSYLQWKEANVAPQVVFEILSVSNKRSSR
jgi:hypothetical protein